MHPVLLIVYLLTWSLSMLSVLMFFGMWFTPHTLGRRRNTEEYLQAMARALRVKLKCHMILSEIKPFALVAWPIYTAIAVYRSDVVWNDMILIFNCVYYMHLLRRHKDPNDRWKKRRKKAAAKVAEVGGKLVVVPVTAPVKS